MRPALVAAGARELVRLRGLVAFHSTNAVKFARGIFPVLDALELPADHAARLRAGLLESAPEDAAREARQAARCYRLAGGLGLEPLPRTGLGTPERLEHERTIRAALMAEAAIELDVPAVSFPQFVAFANAKTEGRLA